MRENNGLNIVFSHKNGEEGSVGLYRISKMVPKPTLVSYWLCIVFVFSKLPELRVFDRRIGVALKYVF